MQCFMVCAKSKNKKKNIQNSTEIFHAIKNITFLLFRCECETTKNGNKVQFFVFSKCDWMVYDFLEEEIQRHKIHGS